MDADLDAIIQRFSGTPAGQVRLGYVWDDMNKLAPLYEDEATRPQAEAMLKSWSESNDPLRKAIASAWMQRARAVIAPKAGAAVQDAWAHMRAIMGRAKAGIDRAGDAGGAVDRATANWKAPGVNQHPPEPGPPVDNSVGKFKPGWANEKTGRITPVARQKPAPTAKPAKAAKPVQPESQIDPQAGTMTPGFVMGVRNGNLSEKQIAQRQAAVRSRWAARGGAGAGAGAA